MTWMLAYRGIRAWRFIKSRRHCYRFYCICLYFHDAVPSTNVRGTNNTFEQTQDSTFFIIFQKKYRKICVIAKKILLLHPLNRQKVYPLLILVRWMSGLVSGLQNRPGRFDSATHLKGKGTQSSPFFVFKYHYIGPYPIHDVVVTAVSAAVSTATITFTTTSQKFFLSFIILYFFTSSIYPSRFSERSEFRSACPLSQRVCPPDWKNV